MVDTLRWVWGGGMWKAGSGSGKCYWVLGNARGEGGRCWIVERVGATG